MTAATTVLIAPAGTGLVHLRDSTTVKVSATGVVTVPSIYVHELLDIGFVMPQVNGTTAARPTQGLYVGMMYFDTTLNKPVFRNALNTAWLDATGTAA